MHTTYRTLEPPKERLVYTVAEAAELLGISRAFAYELVARGELPVICLGNLVESFTSHRQPLSRQVHPW